MKTHKLLILFFIASLVFKLSYGIIVYNMKGTTSFTDDWDYISYANQIIEQGIFVPNVSMLRDESVGPGFGFILAVIFSLFGENYFYVIILNAILGAFITILIFFVGKNIFNEAVGILASFLTIPYVLYYRWIPLVLKEMWIFFFFSLIIYLVFLESDKKKVTPRILLISFLFAFFVHLDERFLVYLPFIVLVFIILNKNYMKESLKKGLLFSILVLILMVPWTIRNYKVYNRPVILTTRTDKLLNVFYKNKIPIEEKARYFLTEEQIDSIAKGEETYNRSPLEIERIKRGIVPHKYSKWERWYNEFFEFWTPVRFTPGYVGDGYRFEARSLRHNLAIILTYGVLLPFFIIGVYMAFKNKNIKGIIIFFIILFQTSIHVFILWVRVRYRVPIDIFIIILASYGFLWIYNKFRGTEFASELKTINH